MTIKMNGHSMVFQQLVQKLEQTIPNTSTLQDDQNDSHSAGSKVAKLVVFTNHPFSLPGQGRSATKMT